MRSPETGPSRAAPSQRGRRWVRPTPGHPGGGRRRAGAYRGTLAGRRGFEPHLGLLFSWAGGLALRAHGAAACLPPWRPQPASPGHGGRRPGAEPSERGSNRSATAARRETLHFEFVHHRFELVRHRSAPAAAIGDGSERVGAAVLALIEAGIS